MILEIGLAWTGLKMRRVILFVGLFMMTQSCIPMRIAPIIKDYKATQGKNFKKRLSKLYKSIFPDPRPANQFYKYVNTKFWITGYKRFWRRSFNHWRKTMLPFLLWSGYSRQDPQSFTNSGGCSFVTYQFWPSYGTPIPDEKRKLEHCHWSVLR